MSRATSTLESVAPRRDVVRRLWQRFRTEPLVRNTSSLYAVQFCRKLVPLFLFPFLARVLGPSGWGRVAFFQAFGEFMIVLIEFGFNLSATRDVARHRSDAGKCSEMVSGVLGAQLLLAFIATAAALVAAAFVPELNASPRLLAAGIFYGLAQASMPIWFFQGLERMEIAAGLEICAKVTGLIAIFLFIRVPGDDWKVLVLQAVPQAVALITGFAIARRIIRFRMPSVAQVKQAFQRGWPLFMFRGGVGLCVMANTFVLGLFVPAAMVGYYASSEKISRGASTLLAPVREALYPRLSHLVQHSESDADRIAWLAAVITCLGGLFLSIGMYMGAPWIQARLLGAQFTPAIPVLRILSPLPFILAVMDSLGLQWLLPRGKDAEVNRAFYAGGLLNLILAAILAPRFGHIGMAWCLTISQSTVTLILLWFVSRLGRRVVSIPAAVTVQET